MISALRAVRSSIAYKQLLSLFLALILPMTGVSLLFSNRFSHQLLDHQTAFLQEKAQICSANFESSLKQMQDMIASLMVNHDFQSIIKSDAPMPTYSWYEEYKTMTELLSTIAARSSPVYSIHVFTTDGKLYSSDNSYASMSVDSPLIARMREENGSYVAMNHQMEKLSTKNAISLGRAIYQGRQIQAYAWVDVPVSLFDPVFSPFDDQETIIYISSGSTPLLFQGAMALNSALLNQLNTAVYSGASSVDLPQGRHLLMTHHSSTLNCHVTVLLSDEAVFAQARALLRSNILMILLVLLLCIVVSVCHSCSIAAGIRRLQRAVSQFAKSPQLQPMALKPVSQDEVGQLTRDFQTMSECIAQLMRQQEENERQKRQLEFQALQSQINPHMIYNTLHTISYLAQMQNASNIDEVSQALARLLRKVFHFQGQMITVKEEIDCLRDYTAIKTYGLPWAIDTRFEIAPEVNQEPILKLLLQPLLENAFIHAFSAEYPVGCVTVSVKRQAGRIRVRIADNGQGMTRRMLRDVMRGKSAKGGFSGVGMHNVFMRLRLEYGEACDYFITSRPGRGTVIVLNYPAAEREGA